MARFYPAVTSGSLLGDEVLREGNFDLIAAGESPYLHGGDVYPPSLQRLGVLFRRVVPQAPFAPFRAGMILGLALLVWGAVAWLPWGFRGRLLAALAVVAVAPGVRQGIELGNISSLVAGPIVLALYAWRRAPLTSGLLLAGSLLLKPLAPPALVAMIARRSAGRRHWIAPLVAGFVTAGVLLLDPEFGNFVRQGRSAWVLSRTVSPHRLLSLAGVPEGAVALSLALLAAVAFLSWRFVRDDATLTAVALAGCVTATPVVWNHTLVLTLPLQAMAWTVLLARRRAGATETKRRGLRYETAAVALAIAALNLAEGLAGIDDRGAVLQTIAALPIVVAPFALVAYVLRFGSSVERTRDGAAAPA